MTIPGVGVLVATILTIYIGDIERFPSADRLCAYIGIVPKIHQSGKTLRSGSISRQGPSVVRWALSIALHHQLLAYPTKVADFYRKVAERRPKRVARVAACRKLLMAIWWMLKHSKQFRDADEGLTTRKSLKLAKWSKPLPEALEMPIVYDRRPSQSGMHRARTPKTVSNEES